VSPSRLATCRVLAVITLLARRGVAGGPALASSKAISTVAFQVRNSFAVKWPPARSAM
jgi:hypothetical protein